MVSLAPISSSIIFSKQFFWTKKALAPDQNDEEYKPTEADPSTRDLRLNILAKRIVKHSGLEDFGDCNLCMMLKRLCLIQGSLVILTRGRVDCFSLLHILCMDCVLFMGHNIIHFVLYV